MNQNRRQVKHTTRSTGRVLLVDDDSDVREGLARALRHEGYDVRVAASGEEAIAVASAFKPDVALVDVVMPGIGGVAAAGHIAGSGTRVILLTGYPGFRLDFGIELGIFEMLTKPQDVPALTHSIDEALRAEPGVDRRAILLQKYGHYFQQHPRQKSSHPLATAIAEIVGGYCHDLANCLGASLGCADLLELEAVKQEHKRDLEVLTSSLTRACRVLSDLHDLVRQFYRPPRPPDTIVAPSLQKHVRDLFRTLPHPAPRGTRLIVDTERVHPSHVFPRAVITVLLRPLLANAAETLTARATNPARPRVSVVLRSEPPGNLFVARVSDNGPGWGSHLDRLNTSMRGGRGFSTKGKGRGFGLQSVYRIVERLGGNVVLQTNRRGGASVTILLPPEALDETDGVEGTSPG